MSTRYHCNNEFPDVRLSALQVTTLEDLMERNIKLDKEPLWKRMPVKADLRVRASTCAGRRVPNGAWQRKPACHDVRAISSIPATPSEKFYTDMNTT